MSAGGKGLSLIGLAGIPEVTAGMDLAELIHRAVSDAGLTLNERDAVVVAQKIVSKAEGRIVDLRSVTPGERARELSSITGKDARLVELILSESTDVVRACRDVLIVRHRYGFVMANAGIDRSNVPGGQADERVLLLPHDPDASAQALREALQTRLGVATAVVISDSFGRPWRLGVVNVAIGAAGLPALVDRRGELDRSGRRLEVTEVATADALAAAAGLVMGEGAEGTPVVLARGMSWSAPARGARTLIRPWDQDLFR